MPEVAAISIPNTSFNTEGAGKGAPAVSYIRALAEMRELRIPFVTPQLYELESGDLLIKDAPLLAEGEWTDSKVQTPLFYTAKALEEFATNWRKKIGFNRHLKGQPRDKSNEVSEAINPHYGQFADDTGAVHNAILSDILVYGSTPSGRAMQELIKRNQIKYLSVEHGGEEEYNPITRRMESKTLEFYGYAHVNRGACKVCRVNEEPQPSPEIPETTPAPQPVEETMTDTKELEAQIAAKDARIKELEAAAQKPAEIPKELSELPGQMKELAAIPATMKALSDRLDALEKDGTPATGAGATKELEALPEYFVPVDRKKGTVGGQ